MIQLNALGDRLTFTSPLVGASGYTMSAWGGPETGANTYDQFMGVDQTSGALNNQFLVIYHRDGAVQRWSLWDNATGFNGSTNVLGRLYHVAMRVLSTTSVEVYINGVLDITATVAARSAPNKMWIGNGGIDAVEAAYRSWRVWNRILSVSEIRREMRLGISPLPPDLARDILVDLALDDLRLLQANYTNRARNSSFATANGSPAIVVPPLWLQSQQAIPTDELPWWSIVKSLGQLFASGTLYTQDVSGALSFAGALQKETQKQLAGILSFVGSLQKQTSKQLTGGLTTSGAIQKQTNKGLSGALTPTGDASGSLGTEQQIAGAVSFSGAIQKQTNKQLGGSLSFSGALSRLTLKNLAGALSFSGALARSFIRQSGLAGALSFVGTLATQFIPGSGQVITYFRKLRSRRSLRS